MKVQQFIEKAIKGGYDYNSEIPPSHDMLCQILLDPHAWRAVGRSITNYEKDTTIDLWALHRMLDMVRYLNDGKTIEEFLATL